MRASLLQVVGNSGRSVALLGAVVAVAGCGETAAQKNQRVNEADERAIHELDRSTYEAAEAELREQIATASGAKRARLEGYLRKAEAEEP